MYSINYVHMLQAHYTTDDAIMTQLYTYMVNITVPICRMSCMHINICVSNVSIHFLHISLVLLSLAYLIIAHIHGVVYKHCSNVYIRTCQLFTHCIPHYTYAYTYTTYLLWPYCIMLAHFHCNCVHVYTPICASQ